MAKKVAKKKPAAKKEAVREVIKLVPFVPIRMDERAIASAFNVSANDLQRQAWYQTLEDSIEQAAQQVENPKIFNHPGLLASAAGAYKVLRDFKHDIDILFETAESVLSGENDASETVKGY